MTTLYAPGGRSGSVKFPLSFVVVVCETFCPVRLMTTVALGKAAPDGSVTVPTIVPVTACASERGPEASAQIASAKTVRVLRIDVRCIAVSLQKDQGKNQIPPPLADCRKRIFPDLRFPALLTGSACHTLRFYIFLNGTGCESGEYSRDWL